MKVNCITFSVLIKMDIGNPNSGYNEDIISTIKKIQQPNGDSYPYISGQSIRRMVRERMRDAGFKMSPKIEESGKKKSPFSTTCDPEHYADDDLFGFMNAKEGLSRHSPVRVSPAIGLFPYTYDRDLGIQNNYDIKNDHRMYETEVSSNWLVYSVLIELDRIGKGIYEVKSGDWNISDMEKTKRLKGLLSSFLYLWGGGKQSRLLTNSSPSAIAVSIQSVKNPIWMGRLAVTSDGILDEAPLKRTTEENRDIFEYSGIGVESSMIKSSTYTSSPKNVFDEVIEKVNDEIWK